MLQKIIIKQRFKAKEKLEMMESEREKEELCTDHSKQGSLVKAGLERDVMWHFPWTALHKATATYANMHLLGKLSFLNVIVPHRAI